MEKLKISFLNEYEKVANHMQGSKTSKSSISQRHRVISCKILTN